MADQPKPLDPTATPALNPEAGPEPRVFLIGSTMTAFLFGVPLFVVTAGSGVLNILAATVGWNPLHWRGNLWAGALMAGAPTVLAVMTFLPYEMRQKVPESVGGITFILLWVAFFWAECGGY